MTSEEPVNIANDHFSVFAACHSVSAETRRKFSISNAQMTLPINLQSIVNPQESSLTVSTKNSSTENETSVGRAQGNYFQQIDNKKTYQSPNLGGEDGTSMNVDCFQSHMTSFKENPYAILDKNEVNLKQLVYINWKYNFSGVCVFSSIGTGRDFLMLKLY